MVSQKEEITKIREKMWIKINRILEQTEKEIKEILGENYGSS